MISASPSPVKPSPIRRFAAASAACSSSGQTVAVSTLSSIRTATATTSANPPKSKRASAPNGSRTKRARSIEPRQQQPWSGIGISPQGLVASIISQ